MSVWAVPRSLIQSTAQPGIAVSRAFIVLLVHWIRPFVRTAPTTRIPAWTDALCVGTGVSVRGKVWRQRNRAMQDTSAGTGVVCPARKELFEAWLGAEAKRWATISPSFKSYSRKKMRITIILQLTFYLCISSECHHVRETLPTYQSAA